MTLVTISKNYRITIPPEIRQQFNLKPGQKVAFIAYKRTLRVVILPPIEEAFGFLEGIDTTVERDGQDRV